MSDREAMELSAGARLALIESSFAELAGKPLCPESTSLWDAPNVVVAHDMGEPPLFFFGNNTALSLFRMSAEAFIGLPSYKSAEPALREERAAMLAQLEAENIVRNYRGVRIAADGTRFVIEEAIVWNLVDAGGTRHGQAATFDKVTYL